jgi:peptidoglycan/LPS O-acetylase OafA/YrhL
MDTAKTDRWKEVVGQIRLKLAVCVMALTGFGSQLAGAIWKPHDVFYPFPLVVWGLFTLLFSREMFRYLHQLSYSGNQEEKKTKKERARRLMAYILCTAFIWLCLVICVLAAKSDSKLYGVAVVVFGIFMILMVLITDREIRDLAAWFTRPTDQLFG